MENVLLYFIKTNGLIAVFYLAYYFLVQKETFFTSNRWFLLSGLVTSVSLPLFFISKIVLVKKKTPILTPISNIKSDAMEVVIKTFEWNLLVIGIYFITSLVFITIILSNLYSLFKLINKKKIEIQKPFALVDLNENVSPFSFFKYIVYNSNLYTKIELKSILKHEKVHSREKHSIDVLMVKIFCAFFWFNPFIWLYKKAVLQNLEYIADQKAIENIEDKKAYQMTLLRVVTDHNCLSITNNFYQSLIKKRIVMLNKNQSQKLNSWKYFLVIPVLVAFIFLFQIKVEAREKENFLKKTTLNAKNSSERITEVIITKNSTDKELKSDCEKIKKHANVDMKVSNVKRNSKGEITRIRVSYDDNKGSNSVHDVESDQPITSFKFVISRDKNGKGEVGFYDISDSSSDAENENYLVENADFLVPPTPPTPNFSTTIPEPPMPPNFPVNPNIKTPNDPNDAEGWKKFEAEMEKFALAWESTEMKKYEADMEEYGRKMESMQPDMSQFEAKMEEFEAKMEAYQEKIEEYQEKFRDANDDKREAKKEAVTARKDAITAKRDRETARRDSEAAKRDSMESKKQE